METGTGDDGAQAPAAGPDVPAGGPEGPLDARFYTPLFQAQHEGRYRRQDLIRLYQERFDCNLVVMIDQIQAKSVTYLAETLHGLDTTKDLHLLLCSPGGDGETAVRLARMAQASCRRFVVLVPEAAKSAATILALGAHEIVMGPTSDLGPIDPQVLITNRGYFSAKDLIAAVEEALRDVSERPDTFPLHAAMLAGLDSTAVQFARSALARTGDLARQALGSNPDRDDAEISALCEMIDKPLITAPHSHAAVIGAQEAALAGLPVSQLGPDSPQWQAIWALWTRYFTLGDIAWVSVYEGVRASQVEVMEAAQDDE